MSAIRVCQELAAAEKEYSTQRGEYARKSSVMKGSTMVFIGRPPMASPRVPSGRSWRRSGRGLCQRPSRVATPYRGYYFHALTGQGKDASGGAKSYIVNGKMTEGFAFVAYLPNTSRPA